MKEIKYCSNANCHAENDIHSQFCAQCGAPLSVAPKNRKKRLGLFIAIAIVCAAILAVNLANNEKRLMKSLQTAAMSEDVNGLMEAVDVEDYSPAMIQAHKKLLKEEEIEDISAGLIKSIKMLSNAKAPKTLHYTTESELITYNIQKVRKFGLINRYIIEPQAVHATAEASQDNVSMTIDGETYNVKEDETKLGTDFLPGDYTYEAVWDSPFGKAVEQKEARLADNYEQFIVSMKTYCVKIENDDYDDLTYIVNGKELDQDSNISQGCIWVPEGKTFKGKAKITVDDKTYTSEEATGDAEEGITFNFKELATSHTTDPEGVYELKSYKPEDQALITLQHYYEAYESGDPSNLDDVIANDVPFYTEQQKQMNRLNDAGTTVKLKKTSTSNFEQTAEDMFVMTMDEVYDVTYHNGRTEEVNQTATYNVQRFDDEFYVVDFKLH